MSEMSPLARVLMLVLQRGVWISCALIAIFAAILLYQRLTPEGDIALQPGDKGFLAVLALLMALAIYLIRSFRKELGKPRG